MASAVQNRMCVQVFHFGHDRLVVPCCHVAEDRFEGGAFLLTVNEDDAPVLGPHVVALAVQLRRVVGREKHAKHGAVVNDVGVVLEFHHFSVAGALAADLLVGGVLNMASCIARPSRKHALQVLHRRFDAPEASSTNHEFRHGITCGCRYMGRVQAIIDVVSDVSP